MNAESTVFRSSRPAVVLAPGGEGVRVAGWLLAVPMRLAATPFGRRLLAALALAVVLVSTVGFLYDSADEPRLAASFRPAGLATDNPATAAGRQAAASPVRAKRALGPAEVAAAWYAARLGLRMDQVRSLQQRRVRANETEVMVVAEADGSTMPSDYVTVRKGRDGWKVP